MAQVRPPSLKNILLTTDFSPASDAALPYAVQIAKQSAAKLYLVHVVFPELYQYFSYPSREESEAAIAQARNHAEREMQRLLTSSKLTDVSHEGIVRTGEIWDELATLISEAKIDLVITGTRGRRGLTKSILGSVTEEIFRLSQVPVLTVGPFAHRPIVRELCSILCPTDFSTHSRLAAQYASFFAQEFQSCLTWLYVVHEPGNSMNRGSESFCQDLKEFVPPGVGDSCQPAYRIEFGDPAENIVRVAREINPDLIVMGIWGAGALARATSHVGNTAYRVASEAEAPVLTIRGPSSERP